jgi:hypothetical protein
LPQDDVRAYRYLMELDDAVKLPRPGQVLGRRHGEVKLPSTRMGRLRALLPMNIEKFCNYWGRGYW